MVQYLLAAFLCCFAQLFGASYSSLDYQGVPLDQKLEKIFNFRGGVYIEVGANDGLLQSNTKLLEEEFGWRGVLIEPSESLFKRLCANRPNNFCYQCALGSFAEDGTYAYGDFDGNLMSSLKGQRLQRSATQEVVVRSLQSILDELEISHVNFFSLDTEGYEFNILQGIDFNKTSFDYMLIEIYKEQYANIVRFLAEKGYALVENFSNYNPETNPGWDGTHNDYLFKRL